ncbi:hypothetical protein [Nonomuraea maritima]|uniref:hypothetical protein n=1 Tax=Nonomuraea maritima TaxID=683260 RepID=UPI00115FED98|nr:hypothetical protein [Nonomuraea maritima]
MPALVLPPRRIRVKPSYIGAGMAAVLVAVLLAGVLAMASATKSREATSAGEEVSATMNDDPNITVVVDKDFQPATTRTEIVYVDGECLTLSSWGNCYQRRQVPVHQRVPVPEQYYLVIRKGTTGQSRMVVDAFSYRSCAPGDEWPACRDGG